MKLITLLINFLFCGTSMITAFIDQTGMLHLRTVGFGFTNVIFWFSYQFLNAK